MSDAEVDRLDALMAQYADNPMDMADGSLVAVAEGRGLRQVFTLDSHFYAYRLADGSTLEVFQ
jgi:predicted nucleic acid-binding protein